MCISSRPIVTLRIPVGSPLESARLPIRVSRDKKGLLVHLDPIMYVAMMLSVGEYLSIDQATAGLNQLKRGQNS